MKATFGESQNRFLLACNRAGALSTARESASAELLARSLGEELRDMGPLESPGAAGHRSSFSAGRWGTSLPACAAEGYLSVWRAAELLERLGTPQNAKIYGRRKQGHNLHEIGVYMSMSASED